MSHIHGIVAIVLTTLATSGPTVDAPVADAAERGDIATVRSLLREGADVNAPQGDGMTALHWAAQRGDATMLQVLLYAGANVQATTRLGGYTALHIASSEGVGDAVRTLLDAGSNPNLPTETGVTPLHLAAQAGQPDAIRALLEHGADIDVRDGGAGRTPLMFATAHDRLGAVEALLEAGADVSLVTMVVDYAERAEADRADRQRRQRLRDAAREPETQRSEPESRTQATPRTARDTARVDPAEEPDSPTDTATTRARARQLQEPDPDRPTPPPPPDSTTADTTANRPAGPKPLSYDELVGRQGGFTALHYAARDGRTNAVRLLLDAGADVNTLTHGDQSTPLLIAIVNGNYDLAMYLLERGADARIASEDGAAPLFATLNNEWALRTWYPQPTASQQQETSYLELMKTLLDAGADPNARVNTHIWYAAYNAGRMGVDFSGATAFWRAAYALDVAAMQLLVSYGADPNIRTVKPPERRRYGGGRPNPDSSEAEDEDPSGLPPVPVGGPAVHPLHAASGVGYGTSRVGQQHRHVPDGWLPAVRYLVAELGVDVNVRDHDGYTAVHNAAARGDNEVIRFLAEHGADVTLVSRRGQTTVDMANGPQQRVQPFPETIALLEGLGAKNNHNCLSC